MFSFVKFFSVMGVFFCLWPVVAGAQEVSPMDSYDFTQFISYDGPGPENIAKLDSNWAILYLCSQGEGKTEEQLKAAGVAVSDSQIMLLTIMRMIEEDEEGRYRTSIPIFSAKESEILRNIARKRSTEITDSIGPQVRSIMTTLAQRNLEDSAFSLLFSYILDGLVWNDLATEGLFLDKALSAEKPIWNGVVYAVTPRREFSCGTNSISDEGITMRVNWSDAAIRGLIPFVQAQKFEPLFEDLVRGKVENKITREAFSKYGIFNDAGEFTLLVIEERPGDAFYDKSRALSRAVATAVAKSAEIQELMKLKHIEKGPAFVIFYHELMWEILERLAKREIINKPLALTDPASATPTDFGKLVFAVKSAKKQ